MNGLITYWNFEKRFERKRTARFSWSKIVQRLCTLTQSDWHWRSNWWSSSTDVPTSNWHFSTVWLTNRILNAGHITQLLFATCIEGGIHDLQVLEYQPSVTSKVIFHNFIPLILIKYWNISPDVTYGWYFWTWQSWMPHSMPMASSNWVGTLSTDCNFMQQYHLVENQKCCTTFRSPSNKILLLAVAIFYLQIQ